ncbi:energy transducer TonB [Solimonas sp. C16B3]|uniref:Energy transducer TonB n=2 Tax=Solimonas marina TaxID=2714601 RepID=A0A969WBH9_9GAMM|nr:energy transducer TonB [Solimonas marina]NKF24311.1 energy transducer TonB [Solimonas marina]
MALWTRIAAARPPGIHLTGEALLQFSLDRSGALLSASLARSSGNRLLDELALRCVRQAAPFPPPPRNLPADALNFTISFHFN